MRTMALLPGSNEVFRAQAVMSPRRGQIRLVTRKSLWATGLHRDQLQGYQLGTGIERRHLYDTPDMGTENGRLNGDEWTYLSGTEALSKGSWIRPCR